MIHNIFVEQHRLPATTLPNKTTHIVMADGRISLASYSCMLAMNFSGFSTTYVFVFTTLQSSFHCVLGLSVLKQYNPVRNWQTGLFKFDDSHIVTCSIQPRLANIEIAHANAMARDIKKNTRPLFSFALS
jgi:hypothetical protein